MTGLLRNLCAASFNCCRAVAPHMIARNYGRGPGVFNIDMSLVKNTRFGRVNTELRVEAFNVLNHPQFGQPNPNVITAQGGTIVTLATTMRQLQAGLKVVF